MRRCSNPERQSSNILGRVLLEMYFSFEDYLCLLYPSKHFLPKEWREENLRRQEMESKHILDSLWSKYWALLHDLADIYATVTSLGHDERSRQAPQLLNRWRNLYDRLDEFAHSLEDMDIFRADKSRKLSSHQLSAPFAPYVAQFPRAGILRHILLASLIYIRLIVYAPLREFDQRTMEKFDETGWLAYELCRTFAGLEE